MPDRVTVTIVAYRGDRSVTLANRCDGLELPEATFQELILYAGHVGVSFENEPEIYGFLPTVPKVAPTELLRRLKNSESFPGSVSDHQQVFRFAETHGRIVHRLDYLYSRDRADAVRARIVKECASCSLSYSFPDGLGDCNCATWLREMGLEVPEQSGQMYYFMRAITANLPHAPIVISDITA
jgi:hypothetical protein